MINLDIICTVKKEIPMCKELERLTLIIPHPINKI